MKNVIRTLCAVVVVAAFGSPVHAGLGSCPLGLVPVGNPGNPGEQSRLVSHGDETYYGGVDYEYNIGKYEVTARQYTAFLNAVAGTDAYGLYSEHMDIDSGLHDSQLGCNIKRSGSSGGYTYSVASDWANRPVNFVSWADAARFTNWLHNDQPTGAQDLTTTEDGTYYLNGSTSDAYLLTVTRDPGWKWAIPTENEWYKAAYYDPASSSYYDYPTGSDSMPGRDMTEATNPGNNANYFGDPTPIDPPYRTTVVGEFELSASPYGTFDQGGNLYEFTEQVFSDLWGAGYIFRGGSFGSSHDSMTPGSDGMAIPTYEDPWRGFRVSEVPEPATMAIFALGGIGILRRRRCVQR